MEIYFKKLKIIDFVNEKNIFFSILNNKKIIIFKNFLQNYKYIYMPSEFKFVKKLKYFYFFCNKKDKDILISFIQKFHFFMRNVNKKYSKKLILKGLGLKIFLSNTNKESTLKLKLGLSHLIVYVTLQKKLNLSLHKNKLIIKSDDFTFLGNFCSKIRGLKKPNIYSGKGFRYKKEKINYKILKKK